MMSSAGKIHVKENRGRYSYLHPEREKYISGRSLGTNFDKDYLLNLFEANALAAEQEEKQRQTMQPLHPALRSNSSLFLPSIFQYNHPESEISCC